MADPRTETVSLNGKGSLVVVDGKRTYMAAADLAVFLKGLPSQELQKIELITSPGAKYDAEGPSGVINIVTKKSLLDGTKGSLMLGAGGTTNSRQIAGISLNHKCGALALYGGYTLAGRQTRVSDEVQIVLPGGPQRLCGGHPFANVGHAPPASSLTTLRPAPTGSWGPKPAPTCTCVACAPTAPAPPMRPCGCYNFPPGPDSTLTIHTDAAYYSTQYSGCLGLKQTLDSASTSTLTADLDYPRYQSAGDNPIANVFLAG